MPVGAVSPFRPTGTTTIAANSTSLNAPLQGGGDTVVVTNASASLAFVRFGADSSVVATTADMPVLPNSRVVLSINSLIGHCAAVVPTGAGAVYFSRGDGSLV